MVSVRSTPHAFSIPSNCSPSEWNVSSISLRLYSMAHSGHCLLWPAAVPFTAHKTDTFCVTSEPDCCFHCGILRHCVPSRRPNFSISLTNCLRVTSSAGPATNNPSIAERNSIGEFVDAGLQAFRSVGEHQLEHFPQQCVKLNK